MLNVSTAAELGSLKALKKIQKQTRFSCYAPYKKKFDTLADIDFSPLIHIEFKSVHLGFEQKDNFSEVSLMLPPKHNTKFPHLQFTS